MARRNAVGRPATPERPVTATFTTAPKVSWPRDPIVAERLRLVAHYTTLGKTPIQIVTALKQHLPRDQWVEADVVTRDIKRLLAIWRTEALQDTGNVFGEIDARLRHLIAAQLELYEQSEKPRVYRLPSGKEEVIPAASHLERSQILANALRAVTARGMHHFGLKGGSGVVMNFNRTDNKTLIVNPTQESLDLRASADEVKHILAENGTKIKQNQPIRRLTVRPDDVIDSKPATEGDMQDMLEAIAHASGTLGRIDQQEEPEEFDDD